MNSGEEIQQPSSPMWYTVPNYKTADQAICFSPWNFEQFIASISF